MLYNFVDLNSVDWYSKLSSTQHDNVEDSRIEKLFCTCTVGTDLVTSQPFHLFKNKLKLISCTKKTEYGVNPYYTPSRRLASPFHLPLLVNKERFRNRLVNTILSKEQTRNNLSPSPFFSPSNFPWKMEKTRSLKKEKDEKVFIYHQIQYFYFDMYIMKALFPLFT